MPWKAEEVRLSKLQDRLNELEAQGWLVTECEQLRGWDGDAAVDPKFYILARQASGYDGAFTAE
jgi:hypothetical protein